MTEKLEKMFETLIRNANPNPAKHMVFNELTPAQEKIFENVKSVFEGNINGEPKKFGGKVNEEEFNKMRETLMKKLEEDMYKDEKKNLEKLVNKWLELSRKFFGSFVFFIFPLKEMPIPSVSFLTVPRIVWPKEKPDKMSLNTDGIAYAGEIKALVTRTVLYGKMQKEKPLFAPHIGELDLAGYKPDPNMKGPKSENFEFVYEIIKSLDRPATHNQVTRYDAQFERRGEPICDFLMKDEDLLKTMEKLTTAIDSKRQSSNAAIGAIVLPMINSSLVITVDESSGNKKYEICFEALIKLAASCYNTPGVKKGAALAKAEAEAMTNAAMSSYTSGAGIGAMVSRPAATAAPPPPNLPVWTEEELAEEAKKRGTMPLNLPVWTEEELEEEAKKRGIMPNLPVWTEEELEKEAKRRMGQLDIPEWTEDKNTIECPKCGYACRPGWTECPICNTPLTTAETKPEPPPASGATSGTAKPPENKENKNGAPNGTKQPTK